MIKINPLPEETIQDEKETGQLSVDIYHTKNEIIILAPIAGIQESEIDLSITNDVLLIKGDRKQKHLIPEEDYYTKECFWGPFSRAIVLPLEAETSQISASFEKNILKIHIPKNEKNSTQIIKIKSEK